jgi:uncharacterized repeat protein (TIGR01451 family)
VTPSAARGERRGAGLLAIVSIGILLATLVLGARVSPAKADAQSAQCERPLDVVLIIDRSGSMAEVTGGKSRLQWAKDAANSLVTGLDLHGGVGAGGLHQVGVSSYGNDSVTRNIQLGSSNAVAVHAAINSPSAAGNTPLRQGMADGADNMLDGDRTEVDGVAVLQVLIFLSDGRPNPDSLAPGSRPSAGDITDYLSAADQAYGIAIGIVGQGGALSEPDLPLMHSISNPDPANFRHVLDAGSLPNLFASIQQELLCGDIQIDKTPDQAGPVDSGTEVTYTYNVWNDGDTPLSKVTVEDDTCSPVTYFSGKTGNNLLEKGEVWTYKCTMPLQKTTTNVACAAGEFIGGGTDSACAQVTVEVNPPAPDVPNIAISKSSDAKGTVEPGTLVTYTYEVKNTGETPLGNVEVTDLISGSADVACEVDSSSYTGDENDNVILDLGETWTFSCSTSLKVTTSNEACVVADVVANLDLKVAEQHVQDCDDEKVDVSHSPVQSQSPQQTVEAGTGTPGATQPNTALGAAGAGAVLPTILFIFVLITSLGTLAYANVRAMRRRS